MINIIKCPSVNFFYGFSCLTASQLDRGPRGVSISLSTPGSVGLWPSKGIEGRFQDGGTPGSVGLWPSKGIEGVFRTAGRRPSQCEGADPSRAGERKK